MVTAGEMAERCPGNVWRLEMMNQANVDPQQFEDLSALADGELEAGAALRVCRTWREQSAVRERWHGYQLIGDVLRSDDLASTARHDEDFLLALRARLAAEPVVLAPTGQAAAAPHARSAGRRRFAAAGAIAAGFVVVAVGALTLFGQPAGESTQISAARSVGQVAQPLVVASRSTVRPDALGDLQPVVASGQLIRDANLDRYLSAHRQWADGALLGGHAAYLRYQPGHESSR